MASLPQSTQQIEQLIRLSAASRMRLSQDVATFRQRMDVPGRVLHALRSHPVGWIGGSAMAGLAATLLLRRGTAKRKSRRGLRGLLFSLALSTIRPIVKTWLNARLKQCVLAQLNPAGTSRRPSNETGNARLR